MAGTYSLSVVANGSLLNQSLSLVDAMTTTLTVHNHATTRVSLGVVVHCSAANACVTQPHAALLVLTWQAADVDALSLEVAFASSHAAQCRVSTARRQCGDATWSSASDAWPCASPTCTAAVLTTVTSGYACHAHILRAERFDGHSARDACRVVAQSHAVCAPCMPVDGEPMRPTARAEVVTIRRWAAYPGPAPKGAPSTVIYPPYVALARSTQRLCEGYEMASSPSLPGGGNSVDCIGNCATGRGYCYSTAGMCANCVLWEPAAGEVLCEAAQGGVLPGTLAWGEGVRAGTCANRTAPTARCASEWLWRSASPRLSIISADGQLLDTSVPPAGTGADVAPSESRDYASVACIEPSAAPAHVRAMPWRLLDLVGATNVSGTSSCADAATVVLAATHAPDPSSGC
jgi:hypothetical protein